MRNENLLESMNLKVLLAIKNFNGGDLLGLFTR